MSQKSSASTASTPSKTPGSKYTVTEEDHEKKALQYGFMCEPLDVTCKSARFTCQWCEKSRKLTIDCSKSYIRWFDIVHHAETNQMKTWIEKHKGGHSGVEKSFLLAKVSAHRGSVSYYPNKFTNLCCRCK